MRTTETKYRLRNGLIVVRDDTVYKSGGGVRVVDLSGCADAPAPWHVGAIACLATYVQQGPANLTGGAYGMQFDVVEIIGKKPSVFQRVWSWVHAVCLSLATKKPA